MASVLTADSRLRLAATLSLLLLRLVPALAAFGLGRRARRLPGIAGALALCAYPVGYLAQASSDSHRLDQLRAEGQALFDRRCQSAGAKRMQTGLSAEASA